MIPQPMCLAKSTRVAMLSRMFYAPWIPLPGAIELRQLVLNTFQISALLVQAHARAPAVILLRPTRGSNSGSDEAPNIFGSHSEPMESTRMSPVITPAGVTKGRCHLERVSGSRR